MGGQSEAVSSPGLRYKESRMNLVMEHASYFFHNLAWMWWLSITAFLAPFF